MPAVPKREEVRSVTLMRCTDWEALPFREEAMLRKSRMRKVVWLVAAAVILTSAGCTGFHQYVDNGFKVGPNYSTPPAPVAKHWIDVNDRHVVSQHADLSHWWTVFNDPVLNNLVQDASRQNLSLRAAGFRVLESRAQLAIAIGNFFPQTQTATGGYSRIRDSGNPPSSTPIPTPSNPNPIGFQGTWLSQWSYGFNLNWELDFWGRFRRAIEAADNTLDASVEGYDQVMVTLLGDIAQNYLQLRTDEEQIQLLVENVKLQRAIYDVTKAKLAGGRATITGLNVAQAEALLYQTAAQIPPLNVDRRQKNNQLCILMGIPPVELRDNMPVWKTEDDRKKERLQAAGKRLDELIRTIDPSQPAHLREIDRLWTVLGTSYIPQVPAEVVVGIPADVLRQRPDVRQAERQAAAQAQQIGIAEAALYPAFSIDGTLGVEAARLSHLFTEQALTGSVGPSFQWNILNYGRLINNVRFQDATFRETGGHLSIDGPPGECRRRKRLDRLLARATRGGRSLPQRAGLPTRRGRRPAAIRSRGGRIRLQPVRNDRSEPRAGASDVGSSTRARSPRV